MAPLLPPKVVRWSGGGCSIYDATAIMYDFRTQEYVVSREEVGAATILPKNWIVV